MTDSEPDSLSGQGKPCGTYVAFDYGSKRIGVAVGESLLGTAQPLLVLSNHCGTPDWSRIDALISEWQPTGLVVGIPLMLDGSEQPVTGQSRGFLKRLHKRFQLPIYAAEERFTSRLAQQELAQQRARGQRGRTRKGDVDTLAAALILEGWFAEPTAAAMQSGH